MSQRRAAELTVFTATSKTRVQGVTGDQTVKNAAGTLHRILVSNANAAVQTLTVKDGATTLLVIQVPATSTAPPQIFEAPFTTSIIVTPSHANIDALVMYD